MNTPEINKEKACCFTGHRDIPFDKRARVCERLGIRIRALIKRGYTDYICGGALGFDTLAAATIVNIKREHPEIRLFIAVPHPDQSKFWSFSDRALYSEILKKADRVFILSDKYTPYCMAKRNKFMVDSSSVCISYLEKASGGTFQTVRYAESKNLNMLNIAKEI